jgi:hypothetical protein
MVWLDGLLKMDVELRTLFYDAVEIFGASEGLPVELPFVEFNKPTSSSAEYIKVWTLPTETSIVGTSSETRNIWILQLSLYCRPMLGEFRSLRHIGKLRTLTFPLHSKLVGAEHSFEITHPPTPQATIAMDGWIATPVRFRVQTFD